MEISESKYEFPLDRLPALVIVNIARYLSNKDVAACCAVSRGVREAFDDELVWKPRYDSDRAEYLLQTPCKVQPGFVCPETHISSLSPVSKWRVAFMAENHFWNNIRNGQTKREELKAIKEGQPQVYRRELCIFLSNDYVLAEGPGRIEILDVRDDPATIVMDPILKPEYVQHIIKRNDFILFLYNSAVQVFKLNFLTKQYNVYAFILDEPEKLSNEKKDRFYDYIDETRTIIFKVVQPYFVGCPEGDSTMHIWNFETGVKLKTEKCPIMNGTIQAIEFSHLNLIITVNVKKSDSCSFLVYDLLKSVFLPFRKTVHGFYYHCVFGDCLAIWSDRNLNIYNYQNSKQILSNYFLDTYDLEPVGNNIVFLQGSVLKLFIPAINGIEILQDEVEMFDVLCDKYVRMALFGCTPNTHIVTEVGSSSNSRKSLLHLSEMGDLKYYVNKYATRFIFQYLGVLIYHFW